MGIPCVGAVDALVMARVRSVKRIPMLGWLQQYLLYVRDGKQQEPLGRWVSHVSAVTHACLGGGSDAPPGHELRLMKQEPG